MAERLKYNLNFSLPDEDAPTFTSQELLDAAKVLNYGNIDVQLVKDTIIVIVRCPLCCKGVDPEDLKSKAREILGGLGQSLPISFGSGLCENHAKQMPIEVRRLM